MQLYKYVTGSDDKIFWQRVSALLNKGWVLYGNPSLAFDTVRQKTVCGQALIKDAPGEFSDAVNISDYWRAGHCAQNAFSVMIVKVSRMPGTFWIRSVT